jgi:N-acetylglucosaminyldiphosphoundecaprenol N-acetyl-beta-D-mannosaminyltransferase
MATEILERGTSTKAARRLPGAQGSSPPSRPLFGFDFVQDADLNSVVERVLAPQPSDDRLPLVVTPNVDYIVRLRQPELGDLATALPRARYVLPDGQPIVWTSRVVKPRLKSRLPGSTMFPVVWKRVIEDRRPAVVVAASAETAHRLQAEYPELGTVVPPHFELDDRAAFETVVETCWQVISEISPDFVFIGISFPKQQRIALALIERLRQAGQRSPIFLLLGGSFEMYLGITRRAPHWMQRAGLEWFFRFLMEPRRLFRRYFVDDVRFAWIFARELMFAALPELAGPARRS